ICMTGVSIRHAGEHFQRSNEMISKYFREVLEAVSSGEFYKKHVRLPSANDPVPDHIAKSPKFFPFFAHALGAMDGTHISCCPSARERAAARNRK
ncbi:hypothetical protein FA15DRAFT_548860, partial [Coprinopsis marcescibilis]